MTIFFRKKIEIKKSKIKAGKNTVSSSYRHKDLKWIKNWSIKINSFTISLSMVGK